MSTTDMVTWEEFEKFPDDAMQRELLVGELIVLPPQKATPSLPTGTPPPNGPAIPSPFPKSSALSKSP